MDFAIAAIRVDTPKADRLKRRGQPVATTFGRSIVDHTVRVRADGIEGDRVADPSVHGGTERAVLFYARSNYEYWSEQLGVPYAESFARGFGENVTLDGVNENGICVGDILEAGDVVLEVGQPRSPCWKIGDFWGVRTLTKDVYRSGRTGWFCRVKTEGTFGPTDRVRLTARPYPEITIQKLNDAVFDLETGRVDPAVHADFCVLAARCESLAPGWRQAFAQLVPPEIVEGV